MLTELQIVEDRLRWPGMKLDDSAKYRMQQFLLIISVALQKQPNIDLLEKKKQKVRQFKVKKI